MKDNINFYASVLPALLAFPSLLVIIFIPLVSISLIEFELLLPSLLALALLALALLALGLLALGLLAPGLLAPGLLPEFELLLALGLAPFTLLTFFLRRVLSLLGALFSSEPFSVSKSR